MVIQQQREKQLRSVLLTLFCLAVVEEPLVVLLEDEDEALPSLFLLSSFLLPSLMCSSSRSSEDLQKRGERRTKKGEGERR